MTRACGQWSVRNRSGLDKTDRQGSSKRRQLFGESGACVEVQVPPVAREAPVADVRDSPDRPRSEIDNEINASTIRAVGDAAAEDHLAILIRGSGLARCETERGEDRIENPGDLINRRMVGSLPKGSRWRHGDIFTAFPTWSGSGG